MQKRPKVKICCISSQNEAQLAIELGASVLGLVGPMPSGPGIIDNPLIKQIAENTSTKISTFLLTSETSAQNIIAHYKKVKTTTIQIVDALSSGSYQEIRLALPNVELVQVIHVIDENSVKQAINAAKHVDYILLDSGNSNLEIKELGGTGKTHNWDLSLKIRKAIDKPLFLAGGLTPDNVQQAIKRVKPYGLDLCSGVRTDGLLDEDKLKAFFDKVNSCYQ
jgi:phosphoribosylanthranilate isomerase